MRAECLNSNFFSSLPSFFKELDSGFVRVSRTYHHLYELDGDLVFKNGISYGSGRELLWDVVPFIDYGNNVYLFSRE